MRELTAQEDTLVRQALFDSGKPIDGPKEVWLAERAILLRRIKNQRRELRRLNTYLRAKDMLLRTFASNEAVTRRNAYQHAAQIAEKHWFGYVAASYIRRWC